MVSVWWLLLAFVLGGVFGMFLCAIMAGHRDE